MDYTSTLAKDAVAWAMRLALKVAATMMVIAAATCAVTCGADSAKQTAVAR